MEYLENSDLLSPYLEDFNEKSTIDQLCLILQSIIEDAYKNNISPAKLIEEFNKSKLIPFNDSRILNVLASCKTFFEEFPIINLWIGYILTSSETKEVKDASSYKYSKIDFLRFCIENGADITKCNENDDNIIIMFFGTMDNYNIADNYNNTEESINIIKLFIDNGVIVTDRVISKYCCNFYMDVNILKFLIENANDSIPWNICMECAIERKSYELIEYLIDNGKDIFIDDDFLIYDLEDVKFLDFLINKTFITPEKILKTFYTNAFTDECIFTPKKNYEEFISKYWVNKDIVNNILLKCAKKAINNAFKEGIRQKTLTIIGDVNESNYTDDDSDSDSYSE